MKEYIKEAARQDKKYQEELEQLKKGAALIDGKRAALEGGLILIEVNESLLVLVPEGATEEIIRQHHEPPFAGHLGAEKTIESVRRNFWWKGLTEQAKNVINECRVCQGTKHETGKQKGLLQPIEVPQAPWEVISLDFITGLPTTHEGDDSMMVVIDQFSKMVHYIPVRETITAEETAQKVLEGVIRLHGMPRKIISDRDVKFTSKMWTELWKGLGTQLAISSAYHPQTDGATERANRVILQMLRAYAAQNKHDWNRKLALLEFATNNATQKATGYSPFFVCNGRHPRTPNTVTSSSTKEAQAWEETIKDTQEVVREKLAISKYEMKKAYDKHRKDEAFSEGEKVMLSTKNLHFRGGSKKLAPRFIGPFIIEKKISDVSYRLSLPPEMRIFPVFHISLLKRFEGTDTSQAPDIPSEFLAIDDPYEWEVDELLDKKTEEEDGKKRTYYLVKWKDFPQEEATWEPVEHLGRLKRMMRRIDREKKKTSKTDR
jgi:Integrase zinc binding domain/Chromo (CHRromatin Organisation MOdifier) domain/Integrase core domain